MEFFRKAVRTLRTRRNASIDTESGSEYEMQTIPPKRPIISQNMVEKKAKATSLRASFDRLPAELRRRIFRIVLSDPHFWGPVSVSQTSRVALREPELMKVCKLFRAEVAPLYYGRNSFVFHLEAWSGAMAAAVKKIRHIMTFTDAQSLLDRLTIIVHPRWTECDSLLPLLELIRSCRLVSGKGKSRLNVYDNRLVIYRKSHRRSASRDFLNSAVQLGLRARYEEWTSARLRIEYNDFIECMRPLSSSSC